ncbi:hypothetical protein QL093DRAFT_2525470, partial [Fusarium oxysporum]
GSFRGDTGGSRGRAGGGRGGYRRPTGGGQQTIQVFPNSQGQNSQVAKVEDALHLATKNKFDLDSLKLTEGFPSRPGYGTRGIKVQLTANYPVAVGKKHFRVVQLLLQAPEFAAQQGDIATDFRFTLVSKTKFSQDEVLVEVPIAQKVKTNRLLGLPYTRTSSQLDRQRAFLSAVTQQEETSAPVWKIIRGFFSSVRVATCRILVNINVSHGAFYHAVPLPELMKSYGLHNTVMLERFLKLVRIQTTHLPEKRNKANEVVPRVKTIFGLARKDDGHGLAHPPRVRQHGAGAKDVEFWLDGEASSSSAPKPVAKGGAKGKGKGKAYNRVLQDTQLPLVNCGNRDNPMYLPAEVCVVLPGQPSKSKLNGSQAQQMIRHAVRKPWENANSIYSEGVQTAGLDENTNVLLRSFGLKITPGLIKVPGRILFGPKVIYKNNKAADLRLGSWNMSDIRFNIGASLAKWSYLMISIPGIRDSFDQQSSRAVMNEFHAALQKIGVNAAQPFPGQRLQLQHPDDPALGSTLQRAAGALDLLFIILPGANIPLYKRIKTIADKNYGIHTICSVGSKLAKDRGREQYMANVALKFNLKLGGINQIVENKNLGVIDQDKTMVVGIDVTHPLTWLGFQRAFCLCNGAELGFLPAGTRCTSGTARPCHYYIVHDEIFRQIYAKSIPVPFQSIADIVEDLTHNMCYLLLENPGIPFPSGFRLLV